MVDEPRRVVVTGGRDYADQGAVDRALDRVLARARAAGFGLRLAHGGARGADALAHDWARRRGVLVQSYPVPVETWRAVGHAAGPLRNGRMLDQERPHLVVAFPGGAGTADACDQARRRGIVVLVVRLVVARWSLPPGSHQARGMRKITAFTADVKAVVPSSSDPHLFTVHLADMHGSPVIVPMYLSEATKAMRQGQIVVKICSVEVDHGDE